MMAKQYISKLKLDSYNILGKQKVFQSKDAKYFYTQLLPEMQNLVEEYTKNDYLILNKMNDMFIKIFQKSHFFIDIFIKIKIMLFSNKNLTFIII